MTARNADATTGAKVRRPSLDTESAAAYMGLRAGYLAKLRTLGGGPTFIKMGAVRYDPDDLDQWLESRKRISTAGQFKGTGRGRKPSAVTEAA
ncbi:DNA-binding protein [Bradyrhizobium symbiodeficiens]|uniref:helix-turn-helix transcriptional regulator n=1 Tax=Bradyrhizobium symbiodeficiens TaxID=1404367 RepID=UPI0030CBECE3